MREFDSSSLSLGGSLLIAHPSLLDPNFCKTTIFLSANDAEEGSFGLVLNRPAGRTVADLLPERELGELARIPVFHGGPVGTDQLIFASFHWQSETKRMSCRHHLLIEEATAALEARQTVVRAFIGYAGWSKGQLEEELAQHAWLVGQADRETLRLSRSAMLWRDLLAPFGPYYRLVAEAPDDPSLN